LAQLGCLKVGFRCSFRIVVLVEGYAVLVVVSVVRLGVVSVIMLLSGLVVVLAVYLTDVGTVLALDLCSIVRMTTGTVFRFVNRIAIWINGRYDSRVGCRFSIWVVSRFSI